MHESWVVDEYYILPNDDPRINGEYLNYQKNLEQKLNNTITLPFVFNNKKNTYSNFAYSKDGSKLAIIIKNDNRTNFELLLYIPNIYEVEYAQKLNAFITKQNYHQFLLHDERNILYKLFGNLSFLRLNQDTNNIYFLTENQLLLTSLDRKTFIFIKLNESNKYNGENDTQNNDDSENSDNLIVKYVEDIMKKIKKNYFDMNLILSSVNKNIDNLLNNSIPKNIYMDLSSYSFGKNFYLLVDHNKIILIFYIENNTDQKQYILLFFLNYKYTNNKSFPLSVEEDQKMTLEFCIGHNIKENNILSITSKIKSGYLIICLSFNDEHFQIVLIDMQLRLFKKYVSKIFFVPTKRKGNITVITDLFIYEKYCFIIFDFYYLIIFDLITLNIIQIIDYNEVDGETEMECLNTKKLFPKEYNKCIYMDFIKVPAKQNNKSKIKDKPLPNIDYGYLYLTTKKNIKQIIFSIYKSDENIKFSKNILSIIKLFNKKIHRNINSLINSFNNNELYFYLNFLSTLQKYSKNNIFHENYLSQLLYIINNKIVKNICGNFQSKNGCIINLLLLNQNKYFGLYNTFIRYNISTVKYLYFIENNDAEFYNNDNMNFIIIHKIIKNNENKKNINLNDYTLSISNNYLLIYQIISIIILLIKYDEKIAHKHNLLKLYIKSNFMTKSNDNNNDNLNMKFILNKFKQILIHLTKSKTLNPFNNDKRISHYNIKKKILMGIRNSLINVNNVDNNKINNFISFENVLILIGSNFHDNKKTIKEYSYKELKFVQFIYFLIYFYLNEIITELSFNNDNNNIINTKIFNLYNINDILYSLDYLSISNENVYNKFFIKNISFKINDIISIKELFYILLIFKSINIDEEGRNDILNYFKENNSFENKNFIIDPILFLLLVQKDKEYKNLNFEIKKKISKLIRELIEEKVSDTTYNKYFKLILLYYFLINENANFKEDFFGSKILFKHLQNELSLFESEMIKLFKVLFNPKRKRQNYSNYIKYVNEYDNKINSLINHIKSNENIKFKNEIMTNKITYILSIIKNIIDLFLFIFDQIPQDNNNNEFNNNNSTNNLIELLLQKNFNEVRSYGPNNENNNNNKYYSKENISNIFKTFCIYFWLFYSFFTFMDEMNNKSLTALNLSKENVLISLLHIYYYYNKKFPDEPPILKRDIIQYINFFISYNKTKFKNDNPISIKMKNIIEVYMDKEILSKQFKEIFPNLNQNINRSNSNLIKNKDKENDNITSLFNYLKINDIQFDMYLKQFKLLFCDDNNKVIKCSNEYINNLKNNLKRNQYLCKGQFTYNKYNRLLRYNKFIEIMSINLSLEEKTFYSNQENYSQYNPQIIFSIRRSIEQLYNRNDNNKTSILDLNKLIEIIPKYNKNNIMTTSDNNTILNYNSIYSFSNNNITENKIDNSAETIKNEDIKIVLKNKYSSYKDINNNKNISNSNEINNLYNSVNLEEVMNRIKKKNLFNNCEYQEDELKCKYLSLKLLNKFFANKKEGLKFMFFKILKGLYVNDKNKIDNQINIVINVNEELPEDNLI